MNQHSPLKPRGSLLERAAQVYDFNAAIRAPVIPGRVGANDTAATRPVSGSEEGRSEGKKPKKPLVLSAPEPEIDDPLELETEFEAEAEVQPEALDEAPAHSETAAPFPIVLFDRDAEQPRQATPARACRYGTVDREGLLDAGYILPDAPVSALAEEFRIIKRQLLLKVSGRGELPDDKRQTILVCSAQPDEGKTSAPSTSLCRWPGSAMSKCCWSTATSPSRKSSRSSGWKAVPA
jgi:hypothetical protein